MSENNNCSLCTHLPPTPPSLRILPFAHFCCDKASMCLGFKQILCFNSPNASIPRIINKHGRIGMGKQKVQFEKPFIVSSGLNGISDAWDSNLARSFKRKEGTCDCWWRPWCPSWIFHWMLSDGDERENVFAFLYPKVIKFDQQARD